MHDAASAPAPNIVLGLGIFEAVLNFYSSQFNLYNTGTHTKFHLPVYNTGISSKAIRQDAV
jgi:hypothetical protein